MSRLRRVRSSNDCLACSSFFLIASTSISSPLSVAQLESTYLLGPWPPPRKKCSNAIVLYLPYTNQTAPRTAPLAAATAAGPLFLGENVHSFTWGNPSRGFTPFAASRLCKEEDEPADRFPILFHLENSQMFRAAAARPIHQCTTLK